MQLQPGIGAGPVAVYSDFTFADDPVHAAAGDVAQALVHEVVQALAGLLVGDLEVLHLRANPGGYFRVLLLRHIDLNVRHCFYNGLASILR